MSIADMGIEGRRPESFGSSSTPSRRKGLAMEELKRGYALKAVGVLLLLGAIAAALFLGPALRQPPDVDAPVDLPSMSNIPPEGSLHIETE
jgi:hypothetical protein